eukprot:2938131-Ditylum_brightwellii.AAC.1
MGECKGYAPRPPQNDGLLCFGTPGQLVEAWRQPSPTVGLKDDDDNARHIHWVQKGSKKQKKPKAKMQMKYGIK